MQAASICQVNTYIRKNLSVTYRRPLSRGCMTLYTSTFYEII